MHVESTVRTNRLWCSGCERKIKKVDTAVFELNDETRKMEAVYGECCSFAFEDEIIESSQHPYDLD